MIPESEFDKSGNKVDINELRTVTVPYKSLTH